MPSIVRLGGTLAAAVLLTACGGGGGGGATTLTMVDNDFQPAELTVSSGAELELTNEGQALHNLTIEEAGIDQDVQAGQSSSVTVELDPGDYEMVCEYHVGQGMTGTLTVE
jgi:plastocyanin